MKYKVNPVSVENYKPGSGSRIEVIDEDNYVHSVHDNVKDAEKAAKRATEQSAKRIKAILI